MPSAAHRRSAHLTLVPPPHPPLPPSPRLATDDSLLAAAGAGPADRVLALAPTGGTALLLEALHLGCRAAAALRSPPSRPDPADVVIAAPSPGESAAFAAAECARRALGAGGRLALRLTGADSAATARGLVARLRATGFERIRLRPQPAHGLLLLCRRAAP